MSPMVDFFDSSLTHRKAAEQARADLVRLHAGPPDERTRRLIANAYDRQRASLKLAEVDALLAIAHALRTPQPLPSWVTDPEGAEVNA